MHLRKLIHIMTLVILGTSLVACGGATDEPDAISEPVDADRTPDGEPVDAPPTVRSGTISVQEIRVNGTTDIQGISAVVGFAPISAPVRGDGSIGTCTTWSYDANNPAPTEADEGTVTFTLSGGSSIPTCMFLGSEYLCPGASGSAGDLTPGAPSLLTDTNAAFTAANIGNYVSISGSTNNDGAYGVVGIPAATTLAIAHPAPQAETGMNWQLIGGAGPIPGNVDPGLIADTDTVDVAFAGGGNFDAFNATLAFGDDFDLDGPSTALLSGLPITGTAVDVTIACATNDCAAEGGGTLSGAVLLIEATNGDTTGLPSTSMPEGTAALVTRCSGIGATSVVVPAAHMQFYTDFFAADGTRVQATMLHTVFSPQGTVPNEMNVLAGHGITGFTDGP